MDWRKESEMFDRTADYYDRYRPGYPPEIIERIIQIIPKDGDRRARLLEIGAGSGKATELFLPFDVSIDCVEPGENLVRNGRAKFAPYAQIRYITGRFEDVLLPPDPYDVVFSAQSFHWIPQPQGYEKCAGVLRDRGYLALFWNMYLTRDNELDRDLLALSAHYGGFADFLTADGCETRINSVAAGIRNSGRFEAPQIHRVLWSQPYTADEYYGFVNTGNAFVQRSEEEKQNARREIHALAEKHGGFIDRPYLCALYLARKM
jgi:SAM-dependent methyltransferase